MLWRLEAMLDQGLEGTALGTLLLPYCSGTGNLVFVGLMISHKAAPREVVTNCLVNNVTNLTLLLGVPALCWGLAVMQAQQPAGGKGRKTGAGPRKRAATRAAQVNRLSLLLTLTAVPFFTGAVWAARARTARLNRTDGFALIGLFLFWQCVQVFDVWKHNIRQKVSFGPMFYVNALIVLACAYLIYESTDWLVTWISAQKHGFVSRDNLGWLTGWLMVLPNAILALYWGWRRRPGVVYSSQVGDGHICIPLCLGVFAVMKPLPISAFLQPGARPVARLGGVARRLPARERRPPALGRRGADAGVWLVCLRRVARVVIRTSLLRHPEPCEGPKATPGPNNTLHRR